MDRTWNEGGGSSGDNASYDRSMPRQNKDTVTLKCGTEVEDAVITDKLKVTDPEKSGPRPYEPKSRKLAIVQGGATDTVKIDYSGPDIPAKLDVYLDGKKVGEAKGGGSYSYDVTYHAPVDPYTANKSILETMWTKGHSPTRYKFKGIPGKDISVDVYNPDQWKLAIELPPMRSYKVGAKKDNQSVTMSAKHKTAAVARGNSGAAATATTVSGGVKIQYDVEKSGWGKKTSSQEITREYKAFAGAMAGVAWQNGKYVAVGAAGVGASASKSVSNTATSSSLPVKLERNVQPTGGNIVQMVGAAITIIAMVNQVIKVMKTLQAVKVGWYCEFDCKIFQGVIEFCWGWREHTDHQAYFYTAASLDILVFGVSMEIGIGAEVGGVGVQVGVKFSGEVKYKFPAVEWGKPTIKNPKGGTSIGAIEGTLAGALLARAKAGAIANVECGAKIELKFIGEGKLDKNWRPEIENKIVFPGVTVYVQVSGFWGGTVKQVPLTSERTLVDGIKFPGAKKPNRGEVKKEEDVAQLVLDHINAGTFPIKFHTYEYSPGLVYGINKTEKTYDNVSVAQGVAKRIWAHRSKLDMDKKVIDGIAHSFRKECEVMGDRWGRDSVSIDKLVAYIDGPKFKQVIKDAYAPDKAFERDLKARMA